MTKPIISVAFMMLYEEGYFLLDDPVSKYLPQIKGLIVAKNIEAGATGETEAIQSEITIKQVMSHTAGFSHGLGQSKLDRDVLKALYDQRHEDIESRVNALIGMPLVGHPGAQWYYSASPDILALLIEKFAGVPTNKFLKQRLFDPLAMNDTGYNIPVEKQQRVVNVHQFDEDGQLIDRAYQVSLEGNAVFRGTHGLFSTAKDYMIFCRMLLNSGEWNGTRFLSRKTIELMTINHVDDLRAEDGQGFGLGFGVQTDLAKSASLGSVGQYHWSGAFCTYFFIDPKEDLISVLMTQVAPYSDYYSDKMRQFVYQAIGD